MEKKILFVDDERSVLSSIKRVFIDTDYDLYFGCGGEEAVKILENEKDIAVIVSDMRMPGMDGIAFLDKVHEICPHALCMVLSAYSDLDSIMKAVNEGHIWRFITKPWNEKDLLLAVSNALELYEKRQETKRLLLEVEEKNRMLEDANFLLEERVRERTWQLQDRNELLSMIVSGRSLCEILEKATSIISRQMDGQNSYIIPTFNNDCHIEFPEKFNELKDRILTNGGNIYEKEAVGIELVYMETKLGVLVIENDESISPVKITEVVESILSILVIALSHHKILQEIPKLLSDLENIE